MISYSYLMAMRELLNHATRVKARETLTALRAYCLWFAGPEATDQDIIPIMVMSSRHMEHLE
jgi:hypothetical protein